MTATALQLDPLASPRQQLATVLRNEFIPAEKREDASFAARILARLPGHLAQPVKRMYRDRYQRAGGQRDANLWLLGIGEKLHGTRFDLAWSDGEIIAAAEEYATRLGRLIAGARRRGADPFTVASIYVRSHGIDPPEPNEKRGITRDGCLARMVDGGWWRRRLRIRHGRAVEALARDLNLVNRKRQCYASQEAVERRRSQKARIRRLMEELHGIAADRDTGQQVDMTATLLELAESSVSNPELRRLELMTRLAGFEDAAKAAGHEALFITITAPGRMHRAYSKSGQPVAEWDGSTPRDVHQYLQGIWQRTRAAWKRQGVEVYGFRIAEPHHDGTPHWHILCFVAAADADCCLDSFGHHAALAGVEVGEVVLGHGKGFRVEKVDWERGSAVGYVAKYVAKNIDGHGLDDDLLGNTGQSAAARIDAWASTWGIRQFQQFGGPPVTVWRELRRRREPLADVPKRLEQARSAADTGNWRRYCELMARKGGAVSLWKVARDKANRYGEVAGQVIVGVQWLVWRVVTRAHCWTFERRASRGAERPTWTRVNNCTPNPAWDAAQQPIMRAGP